MSLTWLLSTNDGKLCMVQFYLLPPPPGNPGDKSSPSGLGVGKCLKRPCPEGRRRGKLKITSCCSCIKYVTSQLIRWPRTAGRRLSISRKISRICSRTKICVRRYVYYKLLNECAFDAYSNEWRSSQTKKYFFSVFIFIIRRLK